MEFARLDHFGSRRFSVSRLTPTDCRIIRVPNNELGSTRTRTALPVNFNRATGNKVASGNSSLTRVRPLMGLEMRALGVLLLAAGELAFV